MTKSAPISRKTVQNPRGATMGEASAAASVDSE